MKNCSEKMRFEANTVRSGVPFSEAVHQSIIGDTPIKNTLRPHFYSFATLLISAYVSWVLLNTFFTPWILKIASQMSGTESLMGTLMSQFAYLIPLTLLSLAAGRLLLMVSIYGGIFLNATEVWLRIRKTRKG